jgi:hypothetical protein
MFLLFSGTVTRSWLSGTANTTTTEAQQIATTCVHMLEPLEVLHSEPTHIWAIYCSVLSTVNNMGNLLLISIHSEN